MDRWMKVMFSFWLFCLGVISHTNQTFLLAQVFIQEGGRQRLSVPP